MKTKKPLLLLSAATAFLLLTGCGGGNAEYEAANHVGFKPTLDVKLAIDGHKATVTVDTDLHISAEHYGMERNNGEGHIHMYLDNGEKIGVKEGQKVFENLATGHHSLKISLHNNDHTPYDVTKTVEFDIK